MTADDLYIDIVKGTNTSGKTLGYFIASTQKCTLNHVALWK